MNVKALAARKVGPLPMWAAGGLLAGALALGVMRAKGVGPMAGLGSGGDAESGGGLASSIGPGPGNRGMPAAAGSSGPGSSAGTGGAAASGDGGGAGGAAAASSSSSAPSEDLTTTAPDEQPIIAPPSSEWTLANNGLTGGVGDVGPDAMVSNVEPVTIAAPVQPAPQPSTSVVLWRPPANDNYQPPPPPPPAPLAYSDPHAGLIKTTSGEWLTAEQLIAQNTVWSGSDPDAGRQAPTLAPLRDAPFIPRNLKGPGGVLGYPAAPQEPEYAPIYTSALKTPGGGLAYPMNTLSSEPPSGGGTGVNMNSLSGPALTE